MKDIHLENLSPVAFLSKYGYETILALLLDDIKKIETEVIQVMFEGNQHHLFGTLNMLIADNLAADAIGDISAISQLFIDFADFAIVVRINWNNVYLLRHLH